MLAAAALDEDTLLAQDAGSGDEPFCAASIPGDRAADSDLLHAPDRRFRGQDPASAGLDEYVQRTIVRRGGGSGLALLAGLRFGLCRRLLHRRRLAAAGAVGTLAALAGRGIRRRKQGDQTAGQYHQHPAQYPHGLCFLSLH